MKAILHAPPDDPVDRLVREESKKSHPPYVAVPNSDVAGQVQQMGGQSVPGVTSAKSGSERQTKYRANRKLKTLQVSEPNYEKMRLLRGKMGVSTDEVFRKAFEALEIANDNDGTFARVDQQTNLITSGSAPWWAQLAARWIIFTVPSTGQRPSTCDRQQMGAAGSAGVTLGSDDTSSTCDEANSNPVLPNVEAAFHLASTCNGETLTAPFGAFNNLPPAAKIEFAAAGPANNRKGAEIFATKSKAKKGHRINSNGNSSPNLIAQDQLALDLL